jgi:hypothetical protein
MVLQAMLGFARIQVAVETKKYSKLGKSKLNTHGAGKLLSFPQVSKRSKLQKHRAAKLSSFERT